MVPSEPLTDRSSTEAAAAYLSPATVQQWLDGARTALDAGRHWEVIALCSRILQLRRDPDALHLLALTQSRTGHPRQAEPLLRAALRDAPHRGALEALGQLLIDDPARAAEGEQLLYRLAALYGSDWRAVWPLFESLVARHRIAEARLLEPRVPADALSPDQAAVLGALLAQSGRQAQAAVVLRDALARSPQMAMAHMNLGVLLGAQGDMAGAELHLRRATELRPDSTAARYNLGLFLEREGRRGEAMEQFRAGLARDPADAACLGRLAHLRHLELLEATATGEAPPDDPRWTEVETLLRQASERAASDQAGSRLNLAFHLLARGRLEEGLRYMESRHEQPDAKRLPAVAAPRWRGEPLAGKSLLVIAEQGLGDVLQMARYLPLLKERGASGVFVACPHDLVPLVAGMAAVDACEQDLLRLPRPDLWLPMMSLPLMFRTKLETIPDRLPYLRASQDVRAAWRKRLPAQPRIGLTWAGAPGHRNDRNRSLPALGTLAPLWRVPGLHFVSLQKGPREHEVAEAPDQPLLNLGPELQDLADTAAVISELDLLITVDSAVAHLAGALGRTVWVLLPAVGLDWRWLPGRDDSPWYPGVMRLYRQRRAGDWDEVLGRVVEALTHWRAGWRSDTQAAADGAAA